MEKKIIIVCNIVDTQRAFARPILIDAFRRNSVILRVVVIESEDEGMSCTLFVRQGEITRFSSKSVCPSACADVPILWHPPETKW
jgi:hypothetical protein